MSYKLIVYIALLYLIFANFNFEKLDLGLKKEQSNYTIPYEAKSSTEKITSIGGYISPSYPILGWVILIFAVFWFLDYRKRKKLIEEISRRRR